MGKLAACSELRCRGGGRDRLVPDIRRARTSERCVAASDEHPEDDDPTPERRASSRDEDTTEADRELLGLRRRRVG
jgi:hypothetical protein